MKAKQAKLPPLTNKTKFLCFDLESNGLHGQAFAIGAVVMGTDGEFHDQFTARVRVTNKLDDFVKDNIVPLLDDMPITHTDYKAMCEDFWQWFMAVQKKSDYVLVSNGYPVEYRFLLDCQQANLEERYWQHPFPIIDLASLLLPLSGSEDTNKSTLIKWAQTEHKLRNHHPLDDAKATALIAFEALKRSGQIK